MTIQDLKKHPNKMEIFRNDDLRKQYIYTVKDWKDAMECCLTDSEKLELLKLDYFRNIKIIILMSIKDEAVKKQIIHDLPLMESVFDDCLLLRFLETVSDEDKKYVLNSTEILQKFDLKPHIAGILASFEINAFIDFVNKEEAFWQKGYIKVDEAVEKMPTEMQMEIIYRINEMSLKEDEKRRIFVCISNEAKKEINPEKVDEKYRELLEMEFENGIGKLEFKLDGDLSRYAGLDEFLKIINPIKTIKSDEDRKVFSRLCQICPQLHIEDNMAYGYSTGEEYITGEQWIDSVLEGIQPEWTDVQKLAHIDTMIGKRVSYTPNFGTEAEKDKDARALWKIITSGYGVCNGIAQLEVYLLSRVGIEAEIVDSQDHAFVKVKNIKIPTENGIVEGDTLVDPTWNLVESRYGGRPQHFCKSYEELRKVDIDLDGNDYECHKNDQLAESPTIEMDEKSLREVYKSIGIADKNGDFPIGELMEHVKEIDETALDMQANIKSKFALLKKWCPEFATCQNSTIAILRGLLFLPNEYFDFKRCIASRVYDREDTEKQAVLYVYMELEEGTKLFFYADKEKGEFVELSQLEFERKFECYEKDLEKMEGHKRPWETEEKIQENKANSVGEVLAEEGR